MEKDSHINLNDLCANVGALRKTIIDLCIAFVSRPNASGYVNATIR